MMTRQMQGHIQVLGVQIEAVASGLCGGKRSRPWRKAKLHLSSNADLHTQLGTNYFNPGSIAKDHTRYVK